MIWVIAAALESSDSELSRNAKAVASRQQRIAKARFSMADTVRRFSPELGNAVMAGTMGLDAAYEEALVRKREVESAEERGRVAADRLRELRRIAPDLADLVIEERMSVDEAFAALREREREQERQRRTVTKNLLQALLYLDPSASGVESTVQTTVERLDPSLVTGSDLTVNGTPDFSPRRIRNAAAVLSGIADALEA